MEYLAYSGVVFDVEWYMGANEKSEVLVYYNSLVMEERIQLLKLFKRIGDVGIIRDQTKFRYEGDKIYAFKPKPERFLCFFAKDQKIIVTNGFRKKQQKLPLSEKEKALMRRKE